MKLTAQTFLTLDGVMQAPGAPDEDRDGGFAYGGWSFPYWSDETMQRLYEACVSCVAYVYQMLWPARLAVFYPYPRGDLSVWPFALAIALLAAEWFVFHRGP